MFTQVIEIRYRDGATSTVTTDQSDVQAFELWALRRNITAPAGHSLIQEAPVLFLRVAAWNAEQRATGRKLDFDLWADTVAEVIPEELEEADPTHGDTLAAESHI